MLSIPKHQLQKFVGCLKMSTNNDPKESEYTYYVMTTDTLAILKTSHTD